VRKLSDAKGLKPCQLLVAVDGDVVTVYRRHLYVHGVVARWRDLMLWRHGG
jgi:hypothetical protein